jgi:hypothetical protein
MADFFYGRRLLYQISVQIEGRRQWIAVVEDGREKLSHPFGPLDLGAF